MGCSFVRTPCLAMRPCLLRALAQSSWTYQDEQGHDKLTVSFNLRTL